MGSLPMDFYRGWVLDVHAGVADDGALDRGSGGVVSDSSDTQNVDQIRTQAPMHMSLIECQSPATDQGEEKTKLNRLPYMHFSDVDEVR